MPDLLKDRDRWRDLAVGAADRLCMVLARKPVRDADEVLEAVRIALAKESP